jgi:hypothetical protein
MHAEQSTEQLTEAEHGHAEAGVGQDGDGLHDDGRHLEVPAAKKRNGIHTLVNGR